MFLASFNHYEENSKPVAKQLAKDLPLTLTCEGTLAHANDDLFAVASIDLDRWTEIKKAA